MSILNAKRCKARMLSRDNTACSVWKRASFQVCGLNRVPKNGPSEQKHVCIFLCRIVAFEKWPTSRVPRGRRRLAVFQLASIEEFAARRWNGSRQDTAGTSTSVLCFWLRRPHCSRRWVYVFYASCFCSAVFPCFLGVKYVSERNNLLRPTIFY